MIDENHEQSPSPPSEPPPRRYKSLGLAGMGFVLLVLLGVKFGDTIGDWMADTAWQTVRDIVSQWLISQPCPAECPPSMAVEEVDRCIELKRCS